MKIVFCCGSLEPGCDGVGDYTRRLAAELIRKAHCATIIALYDRFIEQSFETEQRCEGIQVTVLRIAANESHGRRYQLAHQWIEAYDPEWLSLQFVPFSFHDKGLPLRLKHLLKGIGGERRWHLMFHELWVGIEEQASKKEIFWGVFQKQVIQFTVRTLKPKVVHTQTKVYQNQLRHIGINALYLSLFSNICCSPVRREQVKGNGLSFVVFGSIHPVDSIHSFAQELANFSKRKQIEVKVIFIGRSGSEKENWISILQMNGIAVVNKGELSEEDISAILSASSFGITTTPFALVEKSGTVAAMVERGLPVICVSKPWKERHHHAGDATPEGVIEYKTGNLEVCLSFQVSKVEKSVGVAASQLLADLTMVQERVNMAV